MKKKTVQQVHQEQQTHQMIQNEPHTNIQQLTITETILQQTEIAVQQSLQSVRQVQSGQVNSLPHVEQRLNQAIQLIHHLKSLSIQSQLSIAESALQQLNQLTAELSQAGQTLQLINKALNDPTQH